ncbi:MAG: EAL domain-containing protein [Thermodesulfovibrio sp.]|nr:EAL domain-containing protein [Thermodesulfovibrio sp.]MCX7724825.1 EAL domain-containing protein [Thermodesulfovibrio sp.]MDW7971642.1 EAL domain-containing protein [Thermodesulfovibrio sp.]
MLQTEYRIYQNKNLDLPYSDLKVHFQPIFSAKTGTIFGYEALTRHKSIKNIKNLFLEARKNGSIFILDMICRRNAIKEASRQNIDSYLFINICPETLSYPNHEVGITDRFAEEFGFPKNRIVLEITEQSAIENYEIFIKSVSYYKNRGYKIAIDDFGAGFGGPKLLSLLEPDIVKIDKYFIHAIEENNFSKYFIDFTVQVCHKLNIMVVAEGIETPTQLSEVINMGADLLQGFYLGKPEEKINKNRNVDR